MQHLKFSMTFFRAAMVGGENEERIVEDAGILAGLKNDADHPVGLFQTFVIAGRIPALIVTHFVRVADVNCEERRFLLQNVLYGVFLDIFLQRVVFRIAVKVIIDSLLIDERADAVPVRYAAGFRILSKSDM